MRHRKQDPLLSLFNRFIDRHFHKDFDDPSRCVEAVILDAMAHAMIERAWGVPEHEIRRRMRIYVPMAWKRCLRARTNEISKTLKVKNKRGVKYENRLLQGLMLAYLKYLLRNT